ncbi:hypothetical protein ABZP36_011896 [Zizania latifolia]
MSTPVRKRLMRDFKWLQQDPPADISGTPQDNNIMLWNAVIFGAAWRRAERGQAQGGGGGGAVPCAGWDAQRGAKQKAR